MIILVTGGRYFAEENLVFNTLTMLNPSAIVHGGASGADTLAGKYAKSAGIPNIVIEPNWGRYGRAAGSIRNGWMLDCVKVDVCLAFPGGSGTRDMVSKCVSRGVRVLKAGFVG